MNSSHTHPPQTFIGIVTVLYKSDGVLQDFFTSLADQFDPSFRQRLYVIDNSPDDSGTKLSERLSAKYGIDAVCVFNNHNSGVATGNNQGIRLALADGCSHILLANNDTVFPPGTIGGLLSTLYLENAMAVTPKIHFYVPQNPKLLWYAGATFSPWTMRGPHRGMREPDLGQYDRREDTEYAPTCFMLIDSRIFSLIGLMDEQYFCYYDDTDFAFRLRTFGGRLVYDPSQRVDHKVSSSTGGDGSPFSLFYMNRNRVYFARKNLSGLQKVLSLTYITLTRLLRTARMSKASAQRVWAGYREGMRLRIQQSAVRL